MHAPNKSQKISPPQVAGIKGDGSFSSPGPNLRILHVEDSAEDSEIVRQILLRDGIQCEISRRETREEFVEHLQQRNFDLILADCSLPQFSGLHALALAREYASDIPFIFVSGTIGEDAAIESLRNGATDYVLKHRLSRLAPAVRRSMHDATQRDRNREIERRLQEAQNLDAVGTLAGGIAHDFNNILTIIKGHASLLKRECGSPTRVREISAIVDHAARRGSDLVKEMLAFARKSDGIFSLTDFNKLARDAAALLREPVRILDIELELALDDGLPNFMVDAGQVERILINLIANARDAMPQGGRIVISTGRIQDSATVPCLAGMPIQEYAYLQVTDNGTGMDEATRSRIFEPFFTTKPKGKGTGLGMPVVYGVMQMHRGVIDVTSALGEGTSISLYFPLVAEPDAGAATRRLTVPKVRGGNETLLVVDDEPDVLSFLRTMLELEGYRVLSAGNAEDALALFHEHRDEIGLLFSDLGLPTISGYDLGQILQELKPGLRAVLGSGYADNEVRDQLQENLNMGFISKPYSPDHVLSAIRTALDAPEFEPSKLVGAAG